jgi:hypothetical protein
MFGYGNGAWGKILPVAAGFCAEVDGVGTGLFDMI